MYVGTKYNRVKGRGLNFVSLVNGGLPSKGGFLYICTAQAGNNNIYRIINSKIHNNFKKK